MLSLRADRHHPCVAVLIGMCDEGPLVEVFSDLELAMKHGTMLQETRGASLRIELKYVDLIVGEEGEA